MKMICALYKRKLVLLLFAVMFTLLRVNDVQGQTIVTVSSGTTTCVSPTATWSGIPAGVSFSDWSRGSGVTCPGGNPAGLSGSGFLSNSASSAYSAGLYFSVKLTAGSSAFILNSITWLTTVTNSGTCSFDIQYSNNGGSITTFGSTGTSNSSNTFNGNVLVAAGTSIVLYLVPYNALPGNTVRWRYGSTITITTGKYWIGAGSGGAGTDLGDGNNWTPSGVPSSSDVCYMNFGLYTGTFNLTQSTAGLNMSALNITMAGTSTSTPTQVTINVITNFSPGALSIANSSSGNFNDEIDFNVSGGTTTCGSVQTIAGSGTTGPANPNLYINITTSLLCNGNWTSSALDNSTTSTYIKNSGTLIINGVDSIYNSSLSTAPIHVLVDNSPAITTFNGRVKLGATNKNSYTGGSNTILLGGYNKNSTGEFVFNTNNDSIVLGYNVGTENFHNGTLLFTGTGSAIGSYAKANITPDRSPGTFQIGTSSILANVSFTTTGDNNALAVYNLLLVSTSSIFTVQAAVIPSDVGNKATIQLNPNSILNLGVNQGASSSLPTNYLNYYFDATSTVNYSGKTQNVYSGANYGNLTLSNTGTKRAGGPLTILGNVRISDTAVFDLNNPAFNNSNNFTDTIAGNWTNNSLDPSGGIVSTGTGKVTVKFNGSSNATIGGNNPNTFYGIRIDKTSGAALTMSQNVTVTNVDSFTSGVLAINGNTLTLGGTIVTTGGTISGSLNSNLVTGASGTLNFTSGVSPNAYTNNYLKAFNINSSAIIILGDSLNIAAGIFASPGTLTTNGILNTAGFLTIKSDANGDAMVAQSTGTISGNVTVERYIYPRRAWRLLSVPVNSAQTINQAWQESATPYPSVDNSSYSANPTYNPKPGYGTEITNGSGYTALGFDENTSQSKPSCKYWDPSLNAWMAVPKTYMPVNSHSAYCIFVRGNRDVNLVQGTGATADAAILRTTGTLNQGSQSQSFGPVTSGNFVLISNPYAAPVDFTTISSADVNTNSFYVFDPKLAGTYGVGGYTIYSTQLPAHWTVSGGSYDSLSPTVVQSGQAFLMKSVHSNGSVIFTENSKTTTEFNVTGKAVQPYNKSIVYTDLLLTNDSLKLTDRAIAIYGNGYQTHDTIFSAAKMWNDGEKMSIFNNNAHYAISCRPVPILTDTLFFKLYLYYNTAYTLRINGQYLQPNMPTNGLLIDNYLHTTTKVNLKDTTFYGFTTTTDSISYRNRFMLVFNKQFSATPVPVTKVINQSNPNVTGISANIPGKESGVAIYPNPVSDGKAVLQFNNMPAGNYQVIMYDATGEKAATYNLPHSGNNAGYPVVVNSGWPAGIYTIRMSGGKFKKSH